MQVKLSYSPSRGCVTAVSGLHGWGKGAFRIGSEDASYKATVSELKLGHQEWFNRVELSAGDCISCESPTACRIRTKTSMGRVFVEQW